MGFLNPGLIFYCFKLGLLLEAFQGSGLIWGLWAHLSDFLVLELNFWAFKGLFLNQNNKHRSLKEYWRNKGWNDFSFCIITAPVNGKEYELHLFKHLFHYLTFNYHSTLLFLGLALVVPMTDTNLRCLQRILLIRYCNLEADVIAYCKHLSLVLAGSIGQINLSNNWSKNLILNHSAINS